MSAQIAEQLRAVADAAETAAGYLGIDSERLEVVLHRAEELSHAWSGSNLGYHANVYYTDLKQTPPGAHFSSEWGLQRSRGDWREYASDEIERYCMASAPKLDLDSVQARVNPAKRVFEQTRSRFESIISIALRGVQDPYLDGVRSQVNELGILTVDIAVKAQLPRGEIGSRDYVAIYAGLWAAPHQIVIAKVIAAKSPNHCLTELGGLFKTCLLSRIVAGQELEA
jgi:hypothetical protein